MGGFGDGGGRFHFFAPSFFVLVFSKLVMGDGCEGWDGGVVRRGQGSG